MCINTSGNFDLYEFSSCPVTLESNYLPTHVGEAVAIRFKFTLRQYFGLFEQFLYLHCKMTTCRRKELPYPDVFNCRTQAQHCPYQEETDITAGPFVVWPVGFKRDRKSLETKGTKCDKLQDMFLIQNGFNCSKKAILIMDRGEVGNDGVYRSHKTEINSYCCNFYSRKKVWTICFLSQIYIPWSPVHTSWPSLGCFFLLFKSLLKYQDNSWYLEILQEKTQSRAPSP